MSQALEDSARPMLPRHVRLQRDAARERTVLQGPERILVLDEPGEAILRLCDGQRSVAQIAASLAAEYDAPVAEIAADIRGLLLRLAEMHLIGFTAEPAS